MNTRMWFLLLTMSLAQVALSDDDCTLDATTLKPAYPEKGANIASSLKRTKAERSLEEKGKLSSGIEFTYTQAGCAHYGQTYLFENVEDKTAVSDRKHYFEITSKLVGVKLGEKIIQADLSKQLARLAPTINSALNKKDTQGKTMVWGEPEGCTSSKCFTSFSTGFDNIYILTITRQSSNTVSIELIDDFPM